MVIRFNMLLLGGLEHEFYFPFHIWDNPIDELHHFSRWLKPPTSIYIYINTYNPPDNPLLTIINQIITITLIYIYQFIARGTIGGCSST